MKAPINNLIYTHALNFVSVGIGNTPAFFGMGVIISSTENSTYFDITKAIL